MNICVGGDTGDGAQMEKFYMLASALKKKDSSLCQVLGERFRNKVIFPVFQLLPNPTRFS